MDHLEREMRDAGQRAEVKWAVVIGIVVASLAALLAYAGPWSIGT